MRERAYRLKAISGYMLDAGMDGEHSQVVLDAANDMLDAADEIERLRAVIESRHGGESLALLAELDDARAEVERLRGELHRQMEYAQDAAHVIIESGIGHSDLDICGCEQCERVRAGMTDAGYLSTRAALAEGGQS